MVVTKAGLRALARVAEAARNPDYMGQPGPPAMDPAPRTYTFNALGYKFYSIPGAASVTWDPAQHGLPVHEDDTCSGDNADVMWRPGEYRISVGSCAEYRLLVPGETVDSEASVDVLQGLHALLAIAQPDW
jgi:hypothetical protein